MKDNNIPNNIPFQIQELILNMRNPKERLHIRNNFRMRLEDIKKIIEKETKSFDQDYTFHSAMSGSKPNRGQATKR